MIWYHHWLERRYTFWIFSLFVLATAAVDWVVVTGTEMPHILPEMKALMSPESYRTWAGHAQATQMLPMMLAFAAMTSTVMLTGGKSQLGSILFSLPIKRSWWVLTRLVWLFGEAILFVLLGFLADSAVSLAMGRPMPWVPMMQATLAGIFIVVPQVAAFSLAALWSRQAAIGIAAGAAATGGAIFTSSWFTVTAMSGTWMWLALGSMAATAALSWINMARVEQREF